jgi:2-phosphosulfolactate phosphatase
VSAGAAGRAAPGRFDLRLGWGPPGIAALGPDVTTVVLVDVLRFSTALDVAVGRGARVVPVPWPYEGEDGTVADGRGPQGLSLSPGTLAVLSPGQSVILPSANGSHCSVAAAATGAVVVGASLRNAGAVARWLAAGWPGPPIAVIPAGERAPDGSLRRAVEDALGAGAVVSALRQEVPGWRVSPAAVAAAARFEAARGALATTLTDTVSGRELQAKGLAADLGWAAAFDVSAAVPVLRDGAYVNVQASTT